MPATNGGKASSPFVLGVDGCRAGWVCVRRPLKGGAASVSVWPSFQTLFDGPGRLAVSIMVDIPIGLVDEGRRGCESLARKALSPKRHSSVFPTPLRGMLDARTYEEANAFGKARGAGLPKQTWFILDKIREVDAAISKHDQTRLSEGHPEVAFSRLNKGAPCDHPKKTALGFAERLRLLQENGLRNGERLCDQARAIAGAKGVAKDDVLDACVLAIAAKARLSDEAIRFSDDARDARGLLMEIWG
ncbi:MAG: DUF429 domain-containing protein [Pseudomonadota bacterium]